MFLRIMVLLFQFKEYIFYERLGHRSLVKSKYLPSSNQSEVSIWSVRFRLSTSSMIWDRTRFIFRKKIMPTKLLSFLWSPKEVLQYFC